MCFFFSLANSLKNISLRQTRYDSECEFTKSPDFSTFKNLTTLQLNWRANAKNIFNCVELRHLTIDNYPYEDLSQLCQLSKLQTLELTSKKLFSLLGAEKLNDLLTIDLAFCNKLSDISSISACKNLRNFLLSSSKNVGNVEALETLTELRKVILEDCGKLQTITQLGACRNLTDLFFIGNTNIEDGNLSFIEELNDLKRVSFAKKRHYSHTLEQIQAQL